MGVLTGVYSGGGPLQRVASYACSTPHAMSKLAENTHNAIMPPECANMKKEGT